MKESHTIKNVLDSLPLNGSKSYLVGFAMIAIGAGGLILRWYGYDAGSLSIEEGRNWILAGLGIIGFAHKVDKTL